MPSRLHFSVVMLTDLLMFFLSLLALLSRCHLPPCLSAASEITEIKVAVSGLKSALEEIRTNADASRVCGKGEEGRAGRGPTCQVGLLPRVSVDPGRCGTCCLMCAFAPMLQWLTL